MKSPKKAAASKSKKSANKVVACGLGITTESLTKPLAAQPSDIQPQETAAAPVVAQAAPKPDAKILAILSLATHFAASYDASESSARFARILANEASNPMKSSRFLAAKLADVSLDSIPAYCQHNPQQYHLKQLVKSLSLAGGEGDAHIPRLGGICLSYAQHESQQNGRKNSQRERLAEMLDARHGVATA